MCWQRQCVTGGGSLTVRHRGRLCEHCQAYFASFWTSRVGDAGFGVGGFRGDFISFVYEGCDAQDVIGCGAVEQFPERYAWLVGDWRASSRTGGCVENGEDDRGASRMPVRTR